MYTYRRFKLFLEQDRINIDYNIVSINTLDNKNALVITGE